MTTSRAPLAGAALILILLLTPGCESFEDIVIYRDFHLRNMLRDDYMGKRFLQPGSVARTTSHDERGDREGAQKPRQEAQKEPPREGLRGVWQSLLDLFTVKPAAAGSN
ncbi:MAG: hypothetical protein QF797_13110 [Alphaproteobacteria bacterium]|jgi:hypothetical protein|nr:hypothetical protein [Alphaproteobacteria bacterium]MDP6622049.1 hypothetical protein [Alphaproteobacteria bacterium]|tara:strand:- start:366 stop:692 length:327 start_codon:yes stop_codon:yes gene_type:complete